MRSRRQKSIRHSKKIRKFKKTHKRYHGGTLARFKSSCLSFNEARSSSKWASVLQRLQGELRRMSSPAAKAELEGMGVHIKHEITDIKTELYVMIQRKDAGPYTEVPICFLVRPCVKDDRAYPMIPPIVEFMSFTPLRIHPNFKPTGDVCISILEYSYVGPGTSAWNPLTTIDKLIITISSLLTDQALKYEPGLESAKNEEVIKYDAHVEYLGLKEIVKVYSDLQEGKDDTFPTKYFSDVLQTNAESALKMVIAKTVEKIETNLPRSLFIESMHADYASLHAKAIKLLAFF